MRMILSIIVMKPAGIHRRLNAAFNAHIDCAVAGPLIYWLNKEEPMSYIHKLVQ